MKAQTKMIAASLVVIMLALSAVGGVTYSWFSDTENADIEVSTGSINLEITSGTVLSYVHIDDEIAQDGIADGVSISDDCETVQISNMAPGDTIILNFEGTLNNSIKSVLLFNTDIRNNNGLASPFDISSKYIVDGADYTYHVGPSNQQKVISCQVTIMFDNVGNEYMGKTFTIGLNFSAYQYNTPDSDRPQDTVTNYVSQTITSSGDLISIPTSPNSSISNLTMNVPADSVDSDSEITVSAVTGVLEEDISYTVSMENTGTVIGGINVSGVETLSNTSTISFNLNGEYAKNQLVIYHEGKKLSLVDDIPDSNGEYSVSSNNGIATVVICASEFSTYYAVDVKPVVSIGDTMYYTIQDAFNNEGNNLEIKLLRNELITTESLIISNGKTITLDTQNYTISAAFEKSGTTALIKVSNGCNLTIKGSGKMTCLAEHPDTDWYPEGFPTYASNLIANSGTLIVTGNVTLENQTSGGGASYTIDCYAGSNLTVKDDVNIIQSGGDVAIRMNTADNTKSVTASIEGGYISGKRAIWIHLAGSSSSAVPEVKLEISGGILHGTSYDKDQPVIYSYSYGNSFARVNVEITGGDFTGSFIAFGGGYKGDTETVIISGGSFEYDVIRYTSNGDEIIKQAGQYTVS